MKKREQQKQMNFYLPPEVHAKIKMRALLRNITMQDYIMYAVMKLIEQETKHE